MKELDPKYLVFVAGREAALKAIQSRLAYEFTDSRLLSLALAHSSTLRYARLDGQQPSWLPEMNCNERLEFLGDAVLDCVVSDLLYRCHEDAAEGDLSKRRALVVCERTLAAVGRELKLQDALLVGPAEFRDGLHEQESALADAFEATVAAVFSDSDFATVYEVVARIFAEKVRLGMPEDRDYKTALQEWLQARFKDVPVYTTERCLGKAHKPLFEVVVSFRGVVLGRGQGASKKKASQTAAQNVLNKLESQTIDLSEFVS